MPCRALPSPWVVLDGGNMCKARLSLLGCLLPSFSVHSRCWVRQDFHKAHLSRRWLWCPWMAVTQGWLCASELCWATTPVLPRAPKEAARSKQRWGGGGVSRDGARRWGEGAGARERVVRVNRMGLRSRNYSDAPLPYNVGN